MPLQRDQTESKQPATLPTQKQVGKEFDINSQGDAVDKSESQGLLLIEASNAFRKFNSALKHTCKMSISPRTAEKLLYLSLQPVCQR